MAVTRPAHVALNTFHTFAANGRNRMSVTEWDALLDEYTTWLRSWGAAERTISARRTLARSRLIAWGVEGFTASNISDFLGRPKLQKWTIATYHANLTDFCSWLVATGRLAETPMTNVRSPRRPKGRPRPLSEPEIAKVLLTAQEPIRSWFLLALHAGLRASEIAKIRGEDVAEDGIFVLGKGGSEVVLPCHPDLWDLAQRYPKRGYWFAGTEDGHARSQQVSYLTGRLFRDLGIDGSIHRARHAYGTRLLRAGVNIRQVQRLMRHASLETTANYTAVDEDELRAAVNLLPSSKTA